MGWGCTIRRSPMLAMAAEDRYDVGGPVEETTSVPSAATVTAWWKVLDDICVMNAVWLRDSNVLTAVLAASNGAMWASTYAESTPTNVFTLSTRPDDEELIRRLVKFHVFMPKWLFLFVSNTCLRWRLCFVVLVIVYFFFVLFSYNVRFYLAAGLR